MLTIGASPRADVHCAVLNNLKAGSAKAPASLSGRGQFGSTSMCAMFEMIARFPWEGRSRSTARPNNYRS